MFIAWFPNISKFTGEARVIEFIKVTLKFVFNLLNDIGACLLYTMRYLDKKNRTVLLLVIKRNIAPELILIECGGHIGHRLTLYHRSACALVCKPPSSCMTRDLYRRVRHLHGPIGLPNRIRSNNEPLLYLHIKSVTGITPSTCE